MKTRGFTLVELIMVIMITGIIAGSIAVFLKPAIDSYFDTRRRADLTDLADTALRRMSQDIRRAVPNSVRSVSATCYQLVPTIAGGRYRMATDIVNAGSKYIDTSITTTEFDVLSPIPATPAIVADAANGDWVVIDNQNGDDVYDNPNPGPRARITGFTTATTPAQQALYQHRITVAGKSFPSGYDGGRFVIVSNAEQTVTYTCNGGVLYRKPAAFGSADCSAGNTSEIAATDVAGCTFIYNLNPGATQQSGFVWMRLELSRAGESVALAHGAHVSNVP